MCDTGWTQKTKNGSWLDPFGGTNLWLRPSTIGSPNQNLADTTLAQELGDSKRKLEGHIGYGVPTIAYPFGSYDSTVVAAEKALGYKAGRSVDEGFNSKIGLNRFKIKVQNIQQAVCTDKTTGVVTKTVALLTDTPTCAAGSDDERRYDHQAVQGLGGEGQGEQLLAGARLPPGRTTWA